MHEGEITLSRSVITGLPAAAITLGGSADRTALQRLVKSFSVNYETDGQ